MSIVTLVSGALTLTLEVALLPGIGYLALLGAAALRAPRHRAVSLSGAELPSFAVLVPAHNEEALIERLLASLRAVDYPAERWQVFVVADNCDDTTAEVARAAGTAVYERHDEARRAKGYALDWLLDVLEGTGIQCDAYIVVDADSVVSPNFAHAMAGALAGGARVAQARYRVSNGGQANAAGLRAIAFALFNHVRPLGRLTLGWSAGLKGNGMCFRREVLQRTGWGAHALAEDVEYHAALLCAGERVVYVPDAIVNGEMPTSLRQARTQQARWERGRLELVRRQVPALLGRFIRTRDLACLDAVLEIALPPLALLMVALVTCAVGSILTGWWPVETLAGILCMGMALHLWAGVVLAQLPGRAWLALAHAPMYVLWKCWIYLRAVVTRSSRAWIRTARDPSRPTGASPS
jgi:cellulose synthase/poly-beta-1,6-N-acetylglucosamine synthase-like glycosyltransferase